MRLCKCSRIYNSPSTFPIFVCIMSLNDMLWSARSRPKPVSPDSDLECILQLTKPREMPTLNDEPAVRKVKATLAGTWETILNAKRVMMRNASFRVLRSRKWKLTQLQERPMTSLQLLAGGNHLGTQNGMGQTKWRKCQMYRKRLLSSSSAQPPLALKGSFYRFVRRLGRFHPWTDPSGCP